MDSYYRARVNHDLYGCSAPSGVFFYRGKEAGHDEKNLCAGVMPGITKEQIQAAREADLSADLQFHEPGVLKRDGPITATRNMTA